MTQYSYDADRRTVVRAYTTAHGTIASDVAKLDAPAAAHGLALAAALTHLSATFWRTFTHPASSAGDDLEPNSEGWLRDEAQEGIESAIAALTKPNLPAADGTLKVYYVPTREAGHRLGRLLAEIDSLGLTSTIVREVKDEAEAIERAEAGVLTGRGQQATALSRPVASPLQVNAAHDILRADTFNAYDALLQLEPVSAAAAAAEWLWAAAQLAADVSSLHPLEIVSAADNYQVMPCDNAMAVLEQIYDGESPEQAIITLVSAAHEVIDGGFEATRAFDALPNIQRPGPDLLEDLLQSIYGCCLIWEEYTAGTDSVADIDENDEDACVAFIARRRGAFIADLRARVGMPLA